MPLTYTTIWGIPSVKLNGEYRESFTNNISYELDNQEFRECSKGAPGKVWTRNRKLTFKNLIIPIMMFKSSLQRDLDRFFKSLYDEDYNIRSVTKSALSQARAKLNPWAFKRLNEVAVKSFYESAPYLT